MSRFAPKTLRRMPPATREIARLANELASVQTPSSSYTTSWDSTFGGQGRRRRTDVSA